MRRTPAALAASATVLLLLLAGCDSDSSDSSSSSNQQTQDTGNDNNAGTAPGSDQVELPVLCDLVTAEDVGGILGLTVELEAGPFDDCEFSAPDDLRDYSGALGALSVDTGNGGFDALKSGSKAAMDAPVEHEIPVGDAGYVTTGTVFGGENLQASAGALVGGVAYTVTLIQGSGHTEAEMVEVSQRLLELVLSRTGG
ncbi:hypothetical protein [Nocardioides daejeonensis]|uniref:hypothetical protein n=1 Tax=Nocardioides daejeonensis TaxID=1046556 RepID=UPI0013A538EC|nr:hypothetical protein [Nocardioides daejeonensis]